ncbi:MAG: hypothetical protein KF763_20970 [Cyclobacteriaceae bacterium]|nr:hypothetical protein [Cyclobacteriaceae bacterium]
MRVIFKILILLISFDSLAQHNWDSKDWNKESLGFGCSVDGQQTKPVLKMTGYLADRKFEKIREALNSDLPADQFLATYLMEKLRDKKELEISEKELERIQEIKSSDKKVPICSGCTLWTEMPLSSLFDTKTKEIISISADSWFDHYYKVYSKKKKKNDSSR